MQPLFKGEQRLLRRRGRPRSLFLMEKKMKTWLCIFIFMFANNVFAFAKEWFPPVGSFTCSERTVCPGGFQIWCSVWGTPDRACDANVAPGEQVWCEGFNDLGFWKSVVADCVPFPGIDPGFHPEPVPSFEF